MLRVCGKQIDNVGSLHGQMMGDLIMFLRENRRFKDGKQHCYWNIVENRRCAGGKVVQRQVLYLGEIA